MNPIRLDEIARARHTVRRQIEGKTPESLDHRVERQRNENRSLGEEMVRMRSRAIRAEAKVDALGRQPPWRRQFEAFQREGSVTSAGVSTVVIEENHLHVIPIRLTDFIIKDSRPEHLEEMVVDYARRELRALLRTRGRSGN